MPLAARDRAPSGADGTGPREHDGGMSPLSEARAGAAAMAPMLLGAVPFGLVAGAAPVAGALAAVVAWRTANVGLTLVAGMTIVLALRAL